MLDDVFPDFTRRARECAGPAVAADSMEFFKQRAILSPKNSAANEINELALRRLEAEGFDIITYYSTDGIPGGGDVEYSNFPNGLLALHESERYAAT